MTDDEDFEPGIATEGISYFERWVQDTRNAATEFENTTGYDPEASTATFRAWLMDQEGWTNFTSWLEIHKPRLTGKQDKGD